MKKLIRSRVVWYGVAITVAYTVVSMLVPTWLLLSALNGAFMGVTFTVMVIYWPLMWRALRVLPFDRSSHLALGIGLIWLSLTVSRGFSIWSRYSSPEFAAYSTSMNNPFFGYVGLLAIMGGVFHVTGAGLDQDGQFVRGRLLLTMCVLAGLSLAFFFTVIQLPTLPQR